MGHFVWTAVLINEEAAAVLKVLKICQIYNGETQGLMMKDSRITLFFGELKMKNIYDSTFGARERIITFEM
jgi:hypothetical protein